MQMDEIKRMIDEVSDDAQCDGKEIKSILTEMVEYCEFELQNRDRMHKLLLRVQAYKYTHPSE